MRATITWWQKYLRSMGKKTNPFIHYPAWTEAFFWSFLSNNIRKIS